MVPPNGNESTNTDGTSPVIVPTPAVTAPTTTREETTAAPTVAAVSPFRSCAAARAAGAAPLHRGDPGYNAKLDRDGDGVACEGG